MKKLIARPAPLRLADDAPPVAGARPSEGSLPVVGVRPYEDGDREDVLGMRLSARSLYLRFFAGTPRIPSFYAEALSRVDHWDRAALVAMAGAEVVGIAEYARDAALPGLADLAVLVVDPWQRRGVARRLVTDLTGLARDRGIAELRADVLVENHAARAAIGSVWPHAVAARGDDGGLIYRIPL
ncbi:GNAT family N-acetyltransferase [Actinoallomurus sp. WRP9H-5]|nr:GNAT family N-acetyltransferase [Actinoallomurus rhizosphaericola]MCO5997437.1 GNAT family N-acetyltransferase [Actinoallomurus rhizosphaericola]